MSSDTPIRLRIPAQDLKQLNVFTLRENSAREWAAQLPVANPEVVAEQLTEALDEICRCAMPAELRFNILGALQENLLVDHGKAVTAADVESKIDVPAKDLGQLHDHAVGQADTLGRKV